ncbi:MAG: XRE family transcriptional regulator [Pseudolabrys sp.]
MSLWPCFEGTRSIKRNKRKPNLFADLGLPNPEQELLKAQLTLQIYRIVKARKLTQAQAATVLGINRKMRIKHGQEGNGILISSGNRMYGCILN